MTEIVLFPAGEGDPTRHYATAVDPETRSVNLEDHEDVLGPHLLAELREQRADMQPALWGNTPPMEGVWQSVSPGDVGLFYRNGAFISWATIQHKFRSEGLAERLWHRDEAGDTWEFIYALGPVHQLDPPVPLERLTEAAGYNIDMTRVIWTMIVRRGDPPTILRAVLGDETASRLLDPDEISGTEWSDYELTQVVQDYLDMLASELRGEDYSKSQHRRALQERIPGRSEGSIEYKYRNISAVLVERGRPRVAGYVPAENYQEELVRAVDQELAGNSELLDLFEQARQRELEKVERDEGETADLLANPRRSVSQGFITDIRRKRAIADRAVEAAIQHYEGLGYDVEDVGDKESYDLRCTRDGDELHVEVKGTTTAGEIVHLTKNEVRHAREYPRVALYVLRDVVVTGEGKDVEATGGVPRVFEPWEIDGGKLTATAYRYELPT